MNDQSQTNYPHLVSPEAKARVKQHKKLLIQVKDIQKSLKKLKHLIK